MHRRCPRAMVENLTVLASPGSKTTVSEEEVAGHSGSAH